MEPPAHALTAWGGLSLLGPLGGGARSALWRTACGRVLRHTGASEPAVRWLLPVLALARRAGIEAPRPIPRPSGALACAGWTLEPFAPGRHPASAALLAPRVAAMHRVTRSIPVRPGHPAVGDAPLPPPLRGLRGLLPRGPRCAVHGDLHPGNILVGEGAVTLLDWEEARRDAPAFDRAGLGGDPVLRSLNEAAAGWRREPAHARRHARALRARLGSRRRAEASPCARAPRGG